MGYRYLDHGADMGVEAESKTLEGLFQEAAEGLFGLMADLDEVRTRESRKLKLKANNAESLLYRWLSELVSLRDLQNELYGDFAQFVLDSDDSELALEATVKGEKINPEVHELGTEVKGITYQGFELVEENENWRCRFVVDV